MNGEFEKGKVVNNKWVIDSRIGEGCCGIVFKVRDVNDRKRKGAMKVEPKDEAIQVLKNEAKVMKMLMERKHTVRIIDSGKRANYSYLVMSLLGDSLTKLKKESPEERFSASSASRIGVQTLYAIKQLHEVGYVHRDVKPSNLVIGRHGKEARMIYLIDYGLARSFVVWEPTGIRIRFARPRALLRGTTRYCSPAVHDRQEQGRKDDLWSMMYLMLELHVGLPWVHKPEDETKKMKTEMQDNVLMANCPPEWIKMMDHIRQLKYPDRPDYRLLYDLLILSMTRMKVSFADPYDWETPPAGSNLPRNARKTVGSVEKTEETISQETFSVDSKSGRPSGTTSSEEAAYPNTIAAEFDKNDLHI
uniref:non-specific serine/threonine protein kinase n=1 Tax=Ditylenchus dipsaci TaxID=166011 RepID=A0A915EF35_9BILA